MLRGSFLPVSVATVIALGVVSAPSAALPADGLGITREEYALYMGYRDAMTDEEIGKLPEGQRLHAAARKLETTVQDLEAAIAKGDAVAPSIADRLKQDIQAEIAKTPVAAAVEELQIRADQPHIVVIVKWKNQQDRKLEEEACWFAVAVQKGGHDLVGTLSLWSVSPAGKKVFEAKIAFDAMARISEGSISSFAKKRYIKLFDGVWFLQSVR